MDNKDICWHYVMDIHEPEEVWQSLLTGKVFESKIGLLDYLHGL